MSTWTGRLRLAIGAAALALLAGCSYAALPTAGGAAASGAGGTDSSATSSVDIVGQVCCVAEASGAPTVVGGVSTDYNGWDTAFISWMVPHFAVASQLAEMAPTRSDNTEVKAIAVINDDNLTPNYLKMSALAKAWGQPMPSTDPNAGDHDHGGDAGVDPSVALTKLTKAAFDKKYLNDVIADDQAALKIADDTIANGGNPQAKSLAQKIAADSQAQITQCQKLLTTVS